MQFKTAIILSIVAAASTLTLAAPIDSHESALSRRENLDTTHRHYARDLEEVQEIEARSPSSDIQELETRSPQQEEGQAGSYRSRCGSKRRGCHKYHKHLKVRTLSDDLEEIEARSLSPNAQELEARSPQQEEGQTGSYRSRCGSKRRRCHKFHKHLKVRTLSDDLEEIEARSLSPSVQELEARSPQPQGGSADSYKLMGSLYGYKPWRKQRKIRYARSLPDNVEELEARGLSPDVQELARRYDANQKKVEKAKGSTGKVKKQQVNPGLLQKVNKALGRKSTSKPAQKISREAQREKAYRMLGFPPGFSSGGKPKTKAGSSRQARSLSDDAPDLEARSLFYGLDEIDD